MYPKTVARRLTSEAFTSTTACGRPTEGLLPEALSEESEIENKKRTGGC